MREAPKDDTLESMYNTKLNDSEQLKTTFALYNHDTVQLNESTSYTRLKNMFKMILGLGNAGSKLRCPKRQDSEWSFHQKESG